MVVGLLRSGCGACHAFSLLSGDVISLRPGEECPADGVVTRGSASCSEAVPWKVSGSLDRWDRWIAGGSTLSALG